MLEAMKKAAPKARFYQASSSEMFGKVRRDAAARDDAVLSAQPVRRGEGVRPLDHRELPRELRPVRGVGDPVQPREPAPRPRVRDAQGHRRRRAHQARASRRSCGSATSRRGATGASPATTSTRCGACCSRTSRTTTSSAPARRGRCASSASSRSSASGSTTATTSMHDARFFRPAEVDLLVGDPSKAQRAARLGADGALPSSSSQMMVDADLERHARRGVTRCARWSPAATGFVGQWAGARACSQRGWTRRRRAGLGDVDRRAGARATPSARRRRWWIDADVTRAGTTSHASLDAARPDVDLPSRRRQPRARRASAIPARAYDVNAVGTVRLLAERARAARARARSIRWCSSSAAAEQYGRHDAAEMPLRRDGASSARSRSTRRRRRRRRSPRCRRSAARACASSARGASTTRAPDRRRSFLLPALVRARARAARRRGGRARRSATATRCATSCTSRDVVDAYLALARARRAGRGVQRLQRRRASACASSPRDVLQRVGVAADISTRSGARPARRRARRSSATTPSSARDRAGRPVARATTSSTT